MLTAQERMSRGEAQAVSCNWFAAVSISLSASRYSRSIQARRWHTYASFASSIVHLQILLPFLLPQTALVVVVCTAGMHPQSVAGLLLLVQSSGTLWDLRTLLVTPYAPETQATHRHFTTQLISCC